MSVTVTTQVSVNDPSVVVTVMVAVPSATAVTTPPTTVATEVSSLDQDTLLSVAFEGDTVAVNVAVPSTSRAKVSLSRVTPVTATGLTKNPPWYPCPCTPQS